MESTPLQSEFVQFGPAHLTVIGTLIAISVVLCVVVRYANSTAVKRSICWGLAVILLGSEWLGYGNALIYHGFDFFLQYSLPLHACGIAVYLTAYMLVTKRQVVFEIVYFWGLAGTTQAILTPAVTEAFPSFRFFHFFIAHSAIIIGVLVAVFGLKMRPRAKGLWITYAASWCMVFVVGGLNYLLGTNYMYLCRPPAGVSPFYFLNWPWYILFQGVLALVLFSALYLPFSNRWVRSK